MTSTIGKLGALIGLAFVLRAGYGLSRPPVVVGDEQNFDGIGWHLASENRYVMKEGPSAYRLPAYPLFLGGVYKIAGHSLPAARLAQAAAGALLVLVMFWTGKVLFGTEASGWIAAVFTSLYPFFIYYDSQLIAESFIVFWTTITIGLLLRWKKSPRSAGWAALSGLSFCLLCLTKSNFILVFLIFLAIEGAALWRRSPGAVSLKTLVLFMLVFVTPILGWGIRNQRTFGRFFLDSHGGISMLDCVKYYDIHRETRFASVLPQLPAYQAASGLNEAEQDLLYEKEALQFIRENPRLILSRVIPNFVNFWRFYPRQDVTFQDNQRVLTLISLLTEPFLLLAGAAGLWLTRRRWRELYPSYAFILVLMSIHLIMASQMRYRLPLMPIFILFSAYFLENRLWRRA